MTKLSVSTTPERRTTTPGLMALDASGKTWEEVNAAIRPGLRFRSKARMRHVLRHGTPCLLLVQELHRILGVHPFYLLPDSVPAKPKPRTIKQRPTQGKVAVAAKNKKRI